MSAKTREWESSLGHLMASFIAEKRALGYKYKADEITLSRLDRYLMDIGLSEQKLEKPPLLSFLERYPNESSSTRSRRMSTARQFSEYLVRNGYEAYVIPYKLYPPYEASFKAHIFTKDEIDRFLQAADHFPQDSMYPIKHHEISLLFHLLINCGLRISEALNLQIQDVDLADGILHITDGKNHVDRLVPMSDFMTSRCREYSDVCRCGADVGDYFFPGLKRQSITYGVAYAYFRKVLWLAGISYSGKHNGGPRPHDLRHTFAVNCLNNWVLAGVNLSTALPILAKYLGHVSISGTQKYLQFTAEMYPETTGRLEKQFGYAVPIVEGNNETH
jgi:integrase